MISRRIVLGGAAGLAAARFSRARAETPGVTATEIKIGNTMPYSGPASAYGVGGTAEAAFFRMVNDNGGIAGRKITFISYDDSYSPPKALEQVRRLIEADQVAFLFSTVGTPTNSAFAGYVNEKRVPHLFLGSGADKWGDYKRYPWTMAFLPSYRTEAQVYAKYILEKMPDAKVAILYHNSDFGKDYVAGVRDIFGARANKLVVSTASYESDDPTVDSQIVSLHSSGANVLVNAIAAKAATQAIRKMAALGWKPALHFLSNVSTSVGTVMTPAGPENAVGIISADFVIDPTDPGFSDDPGMREWRGFMARYLPRADLTDGTYVGAYSVCKVMLHVLRQCQGDFSRESIMRQAESLHELAVPGLRPGITVSTSHTNHRPIRSMQLTRFNGTTFIGFGQVISAAEA